MKTVVGVFSTESAAERAVSQLRNAGFDKEISIVAKERGREGGGDRSGEKGMFGRATTGATTGAVLGSIAGLTLGTAGALAIPGIGPVLAAGPISALISGAATGGLAGGLLDWGIGEEEGRRYEEDIKHGRFLAFVRTDSDRASQAERVLRDNGADRVDVHDGNNR